MRRELNLSEPQFGMLSGAVWGLVAALMPVALAGGRWPASRSWVLFGTLGAAVGLLVVRALHGVSLAGGRRLAVVSLASLLAGTAAFAFALSATGAMVALVGGVYQPTLALGVLFAPLYWIWGLLVSGLALALWPLSMLNHLALARLRNRQIAG